MRSLSSNLLKFGGTLQQGERRIIDTNALIAARIGSLREEIVQPENVGFTQGLKVEEIDVQALVADVPQTSVPDVIPRLDMSEEQARNEAEKIIQDAKDAASQIIQDAIAQGEQEAAKCKEEAWEAGFQSGKEACEKDYQNKKRELSAKERELGNRKKELEAQYDALVAELEPKFIDTLSGIYEHLFHVELGTYRDVLIQLCTDCLKGIEGAKSFQIHVSSEDYAFVNSKKARLVDAVGGEDAYVEVVEDPSMERNGCVIKTETGIMDCGLDTQLDELSRRLRLLAYEKR